MISSNYQILIVIIIGIIIIFLLYNSSENFTTTPTPTLNRNLATEACQNIASIYADASGTVRFNKISTPNFTVNDNSIGMNKNLWAQGIFAQNGLNVTGAITGTSTITTPNFTVGDDTIGMNRNLWAQGIFAQNGLYVTGGDFISKILVKAGPASTAVGDLTPLTTILPMSWSPGSAIQFYNSNDGYNLWTVSRQGGGYWITTARNPGNPVMWAP
jgi:hypothetical protein